MNYFQIISGFVLINCIFGSCWIKSEKRLICCDGKNHTCSGFDKVGSRWSGKQIKCFCDEHCVKSNDCCSDYRRLCNKKAINCVVSNWTEWSKCSVNCGTGIQQRFRKIIVKDQHNGQKCDHTQQVRVCRKEPCILKGVAMVNNKRHKKSKKTRKLQFVAYLIPEVEYNLTNYKSFNRRYDKNENIYLSKLWRENITEPKKNTFCATYKITRSVPRCKIWESLSKQEQIYWKIHSQYLTNGQNICVTCFSHADNNYNCKNGKRLNDLRKWRAVRSDNCHGHFKMIENSKICQCHPGHLSYYLV